MKLSETSGQWLKSADVKNGDKVTFLSEGETKENDKYPYPDGTPKLEYIFKVRHDGAEKNMRVNKTSRVNLMQAWGNETSHWKGRTAQCETQKLMTGHTAVILIPSTEEEEWDK